MLIASSPVRNEHIAAISRGAVSAMVFEALAALWRSPGAQHV
jgi:hypothetical protein